jgi:hypothetical protein
MAGTDGPAAATAGTTRSKALTSAGVLSSPFSMAIRLSRIVSASFLRPSLQSDSAACSNTSRSSGLATEPAAGAEPSGAAPETGKSSMGAAGR